jgi:hypothetical protein
MSVQKSLALITAVTFGIIMLGIGVSVAGPDFVPNGGFDAALGVLPMDVCWDANVEDPTIESGVLFINTTAGGPSHMYLQQDDLLSALGNSCAPMDQWVFETSMKYVSGSYPGGRTGRFAPFLIGFQINGTSYGDLRIRSDEIFLLTTGHARAETTWGTSTIDTTDDFHTYGVIINACADANGKNMYVYFDDTAFSNSILQGSTYSYTDDKRILWGDGGASYGKSYWEYVYHNAFNNGTCGTFLYY